MCVCVCVCVCRCGCVGVCCFPGPVQEPLGAALQVEAGGTAVTISNRVARRLSPQDLAISTGGGVRSRLEIRGPAHARAMSTSARSTSSSSNNTITINNNDEPIVVDMHSHFLPREWPDFEKQFGGQDWCVCVCVLSLIHI